VEIISNYKKIITLATIINNNKNTDKLTINKVMVRKGDEGGRKH